jgi:hypothetical protein
MLAISDVMGDKSRTRTAIFAVLWLTSIFIFGTQGIAQAPNPFNGAAGLPRTTEPVASAPVKADVAKTASDTIPQPTLNTSTVESPKSQFRVDRVPILGGAELLTIFGRLDGMRPTGKPAPEVPLLSVLRDTLGDDKPDNDRLRYVWMLTFTKPTLFKRFLSGIPFFYQHVGNQTEVSSGMPASLIDLSNTKRETWNHFFWFGVQNLFFDSYGIPLKAALRSYRQNAADYRAAHVAQALSILKSYDRLQQRSRDESELLARRSTDNYSDQSSMTGMPVSDAGAPLLAESTFTPAEMTELRARLILSGTTFGGLFTPELFSETVTRHSMDSTDTIGHNWEMLRQRAEAQGLYFEPLKMPDGTPTHALLWIAKSDLLIQTERRYDGRFLSISNPWKDPRLKNWKGYSQLRYFDQDNRTTSPTDPEGHAVEMIPLALYGLDHPRIPAVLIDFRDSLNPKRREVSRRLFGDVTKNVFSLSSFGNLPYFVSHKTYGFITGRRGVDLNQPTRIGSYSELKLLLSFNENIEPRLRGEIEQRLESVSLNPLTNDNQAEVNIARQQYDALLDFARRPDGLAAKIERDRRAEMVRLKHGSTARFFFNLGNVLTFGHYVHREAATPELSARMESARVVRYHVNFLIEVAKSSPETEVVWDMKSVRHSLQVLASDGTAASGSAAHASAMIFQRTHDEEARRLCLDALYKMNNKPARKELLSLLRTEPQSEWHSMIADHLRKAVAEDIRMKPADIKAVLSQVGQP